MSFSKRFTGVALLFALGFLAGATVSSSFDLNPGGRWAEVLEARALTTFRLLLCGVESE